jgi:hypothetical protein
LSNSDFIKLSIAGWCLNILDGFLTLFSISKGWAFEVNPMMAYLMEISPYLFLGYKAIIGIAYFAMYKVNYLKFTILAFVLYLIIDIWHFIIIFWAILH